MITFKHFQATLVTRCMFLVATMLLSVSFTYMANANTQTTADKINPAQPASDSLVTQFHTPPNSARPRVWWHWMNGNITKEGIDKDLAWMNSIGIGGLQNFDANLMTPQVVPERLIYMSDKWKDAFRHAVQTADAYGLEFTIASSAGWSETGGPWVKPEDGMKKLVWAETLVEGGKRFTGALPKPPAITGPFQNAPFSDLHAPGGAAKLPTLYRDAILFAYPVKHQPLPVPVVTLADGSKVDGALLFDQDLATAVKVSRPSPSAPISLILDYGKPVTVRSANLFIQQVRPPFTDAAYRPVLEADIAGTWQPVSDFELTEVPTTIGFKPVKAQRFRLVLEAYTGPRLVPAPEHAPGAVNMDIFAAPKRSKEAIAAFYLSAEAQVDHFEAKAGFALLLDYNQLAKRRFDQAPAIDPAKVIDLSDRLRPDGTLDWTAPRGSDWRIVRMGYSLTGKTNHPATAEATGLEVDKYDTAAVRRYLEIYLGMYRDAVGAEWMGARGIRALLTDSIEAGPSNWTPRLLEEFKTRRGYDARPWLPALTGAIVGSTARSDAFLHDFRQTLADLLADAHYGTIAKVAHEHGLIVYGEALENGRPVLGDDLAMRSHADVPMAALWAFNRGTAPRSTGIGDMKGAASVAHVYGRSIVSAESMTSIFSPWAFAPADLKRIIDLEFASGINRPIIHTSVHQPVDNKLPGLSLMFFGQYFNRHETWAEMAKPWIDYIARTGFMLQQGRNYADVAYFYGEDAPITALFAHKVPDDLPQGYAYDLVNAEMLLKQFQVVQGDLVSLGGARYKVLYLGGNSHVMTLPTLQRIAALVDAGATVIGMAPEYSPALQDSPAVFRKLVKRLWSGAPTTKLGKGQVIASSNVDAALQGLGISADFSYIGAADSDYLFVHRQLPEGELYFVNNRTAKAEKIEARFRVKGYKPELWRAVSGTTEAISYRIEGDTTVIPLDIAAEDAFFILFRQPTSVSSQTVTTTKHKTLATLSAPWTVHFQKDRGAPDSILMPILQPLDTHENPGVRYFSGVATYNTRFELPKTIMSGTPLFIDLGQIGDVADVTVNGKPAGISWLAPYRLDISKLVQKGTNTLEIKIANLWVNRLIGDRQPGASKVTFTTTPTYNLKAPLRRSGLIGPVQLSTIEVTEQ